MTDKGYQSTSSTSTARVGSTCEGVWRIASASFRRPLYGPLVKVNASYVSQVDFNHTTMAAADEATAKHGTSGVCQSIGRSYGSGFANACGEPGQPSKPTPRSP
ncbi:hypothetical protein N7527_007194 [Penicillium freii]|nr:hypothetical protein N7527_007194 [Penicillium freii]